MQSNAYRVWAETAKDEENICKEKSVSELSILIFYILLTVHHFMNLGK
jgi:hypothetical protein